MSWQISKVASSLRFRAADVFEWVEGQLNEARESAVKGRCRPSFECVDSVPHQLSKLIFNVEHKLRHEIEETRTSISARGSSYVRWDLQG